MAVQLSGLGGFDSSNVISQLVTIASAPLREIDTKKTQVDAASSTLNTFSSRLSTLKSNALALSTTTGMSSIGASAADTTMMSASVTGTGVLSSSSSYSVEVSQLARAQKSLGQPQASATTALGQEGQLKIKVGTSDAVTIDIAATDTLADLTTKIAQSGARVSAGLINAGGGYRLALQGLDSGSEKAITFEETGTVSLGLSTLETAQDAKLKVDGLDVTRPTNQIEDAIPGVKLALTKTGTTTVKLGADPTVLKQKLSAFMSSFNDVVNAGHSAAGYGSTKATNAVLAADPGIRRTLDRITSGVSSKALAGLGLSLTKDGTMTFDETKLSNDPSNVAAAATMMKSLATAVEGLVTGTGAVKSRIDSLSAQSKRLTESRTKKEERVTQYEQNLRQQFSKLDQAMSRYQSMSSALTGLGT